VEAAIGVPFVSNDIGFVQTTLHLRILWCLWKHRGNSKAEYPASFSGEEAPLKAPAIEKKLRISQG
jgi:hypothetical protein